MHTIHSKDLVETILDKVPHDVRFRTVSLLSRSTWKSLTSYSLMQIHSEVVILFVRSFAVEYPIFIRGKAVISDCRTVLEYSNNAALRTSRSCDSWFPRGWRQDAYEPEFGGPP